MAVKRRAEREISEREKVVKKMRGEEDDDPLVELKLCTENIILAGIIKKKLTNSDLDHLSRVILPGKQVRNYVLPFLYPAELDEVERGNGRGGLMVRVKDLDTDTIHWLSFKKWESSGSYKLGLSWIQDFVKRRNLHKDDEIVMFWVDDDSTRRGFFFSVVKRFYPPPDPSLCEFAREFLSLSPLTPDYNSAWKERCSSIDDYLAVRN
ncbi:B3 domain-containing protein At2g33720-like [Telopea speciosissima]|uniref:B3 domain-containing protein At2g33720-like n=1 Tax=Telopea speciosissima TaxID=54955 RepID=UPI001CC5CD4D|nr:B3 domain-containing protein At2g33720-like [Telopea speciosissima]